MKLMDTMFKDERRTYATVDAAVRAVAKMETQVLPPTQEFRVWMTVGPNNRIRPVIHLSKDQQHYAGALAQQGWMVTL